MTSILYGIHVNGEFAAPVRVGLYRKDGSAVYSCWVNPGVNYAPLPRPVEGMPGDYVRLEASTEGYMPTFGVFMEAKNDE